MAAALVVGVVLGTTAGSAGVDEDLERETARVSALESDIELLTAELEDADEARSTWEADLGGMRDEVASLREELADADVETQRLRGEAVPAAELEVLAAELDERASALDDRSAEIDAAEAELLAQREDLDARAAEVDARAAEVDVRASEGTSEGGSAGSSGGSSSPSTAAPSSPSGGAASPDPAPQSSTASATENPSSCAPGQVDINSATVAELQRIIHIGPARAEVIPGLRPFASVRELTRISGIADARISDIIAQGTACVG